MPQWGSMMKQYLCGIKSHAFPYAKLIGAQPCACCHVTLYITASRMLFFWPVISPAPGGRLLQFYVCYYF